MQGIFVSYDANTGRGTIYQGAYEDYSNMKAWSRIGTKPEGGQSSPDPDDQCFYFQVAEEHKHKMTIRIGQPVEYDRVSDGSMEVTHLRF